MPKPKKRKRNKIKRKGTGKKPKLFNQIIEGAPRIPTKKAAEIAVRLRALTPKTRAKKGSKQELSKTKMYLIISARTGASKSTVRKMRNPRFLKAATELPEYKREMKKFEETNY